MASACREISFKVDVKSICYVEWIVHRNFSVNKFEKQVINSPFFWFEKDAWCIELQFEAWKNNVVQNVKLCVGNRKRLMLTRIRVKLGIVGRDEEQLAVVNGLLDDIGIFKAHLWLSSSDILNIVDNCYGRLTIFCQLENFP